MLELLLRLVFSLAAVVGLMLLLARLAQRRFSGRPDAVVSVVHRQPISRHASVAVVTVGSRVLVLGATDQQVQMLTELDAADLAAVQAAPTTAQTTAQTTARAAGQTTAEPVGTLDVALPGLDRLGPAAAPSPFARLLEDETDRAGATGARSAGEQPALALVGAPGRRRATVEGPLTGSLLSPTTWRRAYQAVTRRAS